MGHGSSPCGHKEGPREEGVCLWTRLLSRCEGMACAKAWGLKAPVWETVGDLVHGMQKYMCGAEGVLGSGQGVLGLEHDMRRGGSVLRDPDVQAGLRPPSCTLQEMGANEFLFVSK